MYTLPDLPESTAREVYARLCTTLEMLPAESPEARAARDADAMAAVAALYPTDAIEARLAADIVAMEAYATDSLRLAGEFRADTAATLRCRAQATAMYRQMRSLLRDYRAMQAERDKAFNEGHPATMQRAGYWWKEVTIPAAAPSPAPAARAGTRGPAGTRPGAGVREPHRGRAVRRALPWPRQADPGRGRPAGAARLRPARAGHRRCPGARHRPILLALDRPALAEAAE